MKIYAAILLAFAISFTSAGKQTFSFVDTLPKPAYVFIIPIEKRNAKTDVEKLANWECIGTDQKITVRCAPGTRQACQLIVDEKDTEVTKTGSRILRRAVKIAAEREGEFWFVTNFVSSNNYTAKIFNEENAAAPIP